MQILQGGAADHGHEQIGHLLGGASATSRTQRYFFSNHEDAVRFQTHLTVMKESGRKLKLIFSEIDSRNTGHITSASLYRSMKTNGMAEEGNTIGGNPKDEAERMINLADADVSDGIDFSGEFLFAHHTIHTCEQGGGGANRATNAVTNKHGHEHGH